MYDGRTLIMNYYIIPEAYRSTQNFVSASRSKRTSSIRPKKQLSKFKTGYDVLQLSKPFTPNRQ